MGGCESEEIRMSETLPLHMLSLEFDASRIFALARRRRLPQHDLDPGYLIHCQLGELFGEYAPRLFSLENTKCRTWRVLAYSKHEATFLREYADAYADPSIHAALDWKHFASKNMPGHWQIGRTLAFKVRACPTVRMDREGAYHRKGAEVDVFLSKCWSNEDPQQIPDRSKVYCDWLESQFNRLGGISLQHVQIDNFKLQRLIRRTQGAERKARTLERPDVTFRGEFTVIDSLAFDHLIRRGIGRHRAFGFGMLLLMPPRNPSC